MTCVLSAKAATLEAVQQLKETCGAPLIGTHSGTFHTDEVTAAYLLKQLPEYKDSPIIRTRDNAVYDLCDIVVDAAGEYNAEAKRFDHHQRPFDTKWSETRNLTKLSSAGLIWKHYGKRYLSEVRGVDGSVVDTLHEDLYRLVFENIDAGDNGFRACKTKPVYHGGMPGVGRLVSSCNTSWIIPEKQDETVCFQEAYKVMANEFEAILTNYIKYWLDARREMEEALTKKSEIHPSGRIVELGKWAAYKDCLPLLDPEASNKDKSVIIAVIPVTKDTYTLASVGFYGFPLRLPSDPMSREEALKHAASAVEAM